MENHYYLQCNIRGQINYKCITYSTEYLYDLVQYTFKIINTTINQYWGTVNNFMSNKTASARLYHNDVFIAPLHNKTIWGEYTVGGGDSREWGSKKLEGERKKGGVDNTSTNGHAPFKGQVATFGKTSKQNGWRQFRRRGIGGAP